LPYTEDEDGYLTLTMPNWGGDNTIPFISIGDDYGDIVHGVLLDPHTYDGQFVQAISELATPEELVAAVQKGMFCRICTSYLTDQVAATGKKSRFNEVKDWTTIETYGEPEIETVKNLFGFVQYTGGKYFGVASDIALSKQLKAAAAAAGGRPAGDGKLITVEQFTKKALSA
jgi:hypothetical protein